MPGSLEIVVAPVAELAARFANDVRREVADTNAERAYTLAVPGGGMVEAVFPVLARAPIDWSRVHVFWVDERAVPPSSPESNYALAERLWLLPAGVPGDVVHRMEAELGADSEGAGDAAAMAYAGELRAYAGDPVQVDHVLLGVGPDGHVGSIFPGRGGDGEGDVRFVIDSPKPPPRRMTLTLDAILRARRVTVASFGESKAETFAHALGEHGGELPVGQVLRRAGPTTLLLDPAAAARLPAQR